MNVKWYQVSNKQLLELGVDPNLVDTCEAIPIAPTKSMVETIYGRQLTKGEWDLFIFEYHNSKEADNIDSSINTYIINWRAKHDKL